MIRVLIDENNEITKEQENILEQKITQFKFKTILEKNIF